MAIENFEKKLKDYAELIVKVGLNVQAGQKVIIRAAVNLAPVVREIATVAYQLGSPLVTILWSDEEVSRIRHKYAPRDSFNNSPTWMYEGVAQEIREGAAYLQVFGRDPELLAGMDQAVISASRQAAAKDYRPIGELQGESATQWTLVSPPTPGWAKRVFPELDADAALEKLWEAVFTLCRIDNDDPVAVWRQHITELKSRREALTAKGYTAMHFRAPGTDIKIGLPKDHIWMGGGSLSSDSTAYAANIPTEEVFTVPHREQTEGTVSSTKPLNYYGSIIDNFSLTFEKGKVVKYSAERGEEFLREMIETDDGAAALGEVAIVPHLSPISQSNITFLNTLYDENASCHFALGRAYKFNLEGGPEMSNDEFFAAGGNNSNIHVDFMFGSGEMDVDGIKADGTVEPVLRGGEWAFDV